MIFLNHCGVSRMSKLARDAAVTQLDLQADKGALMFAGFQDPVDRFREAGGRLLETSSANVSYVRNTSEGLGLVAAGYPVKPGDEIISYEHEYPANHYPWRLMEKRGAKLLLVPNRSYAQISDKTGIPDGPCGFSLDDIESRITQKTRIIALSHVQFPTGFAADLQRLGKLCRDRGIDLIVDAAQSFGVLPVHPEKAGIAALGCSGWKWLMGPVGTGLLYTSPELRDKIEITMAGADLMQQGMDYLNHTWNPFLDGRKFQYSTHDFAGPAALAAVMEAAAERGIENIQSHVFDLQDAFLARLDQDRMRPLLYASANRSGILSLFPATGAADQIAAKLAEEGIVVSPRAGFIRIGAQYINTREDVEAAADALNRA